MGRGRSALTATLAVLFLASGCNPGADEHATTQTDLARAAQVRSDPWLAPWSLDAPSSRYGSDGEVTRRAGSRQTAYDVGPRRAALLEVRAATRHGWRLVGADCGPEEVVAQMARGSSREDGSQALVTARAQDDERWSRVRVEAMVPHHADGSWPASPEVATGATCLLGRSDDAPVTELDDQPLDGDRAESGAEEFEGWQRDELTDEEQELLGAVRTDTWFATTGVRLEVPDLRTGDSRRSGASATGELSDVGTGFAGVAEAVRRMSSWELIWTSCTRGTTVARLRLVAGDAVALAEVRADPSTGGQATFVVQLPVPEGPDPSWVAQAPAREWSRCLSAPGPRERVFTQGVPVGVSAVVQPSAS